MRAPREDAERLRNRALAAQSRVRILEFLHREGRALDTSELSALVGLHPSTIRFHLQALEGAGLVQRRTERLGRPGRPHVAFAAAAEPPSRSAGGFELLSRILASSLSGKVQDPADLAREAGQAWGRTIAEERRAPLRPGGGEAMRTLATMLEDLGFAPEIETDGPVAAISLRRCPFGEVAEADPGVVCSVHFGLMQGALAAWRAGLRVDGLEPFVEPDRCRARFSEVTYEGVPR